jgi:hypothetical protein
LSLFKYFGEQNHEKHNGQLFWSANMEAPFRGRAAPLLKQDEFDRMETNYDAHVKTFNTGDPEQLKQFEDILDRAANGNWYIVRHIERHWNSETNTMMVYVEWLQRYSALPPNVQQGAF